MDVEMPLLDNWHDSCVAHEKMRRTVADEAGELSTAPSTRCLTPNIHVPVSRSRIAC
jgi:hypothetical protein